MTKAMFPILSFERITNQIADIKLKEWGHWLGGCNRPFGRQSFGLVTTEGEILAVAVSASTVNKTCAGYDRNTVVELARLCSHPDHRDLSRVILRLWRKYAATIWADHYWPVKALVSYSNNLRHTGDLYRFDGWKKVADVKGGGAGKNTVWKRKRTMQKDPKSVWVFDLEERHG